MRRGRCRRGSESASARRSGDCARSPADVALRVRTAAGRRRRRHGARVLGPGRGPRSRRDRAPRAAGGGARRAVRRDGGAAACAADLPRPARARLRTRRHPGVVRARHAPPRSSRPRLPRAARLRRREPVGAALRRVPVAGPGAHRRGLAPMARIWCQRRRSRPTTQFWPPCPRTLAPKTPRRSTRRHRPASATPTIASSPARCARRGAGRSCWSRPTSSRASIAGSGGCPGLRAEYERRLKELADEDQDSPRLARPGPRSRRAAPPGVVRAADRRRARQLGQRPQLGRVAHRLRGAGAARAAAAGPRAARARRDGAARQRRAGDAARGARGAGASAC